MANQFKVGDVVTLKSGDPPMTIAEIDTYGDDHPKALCVWFDGNKQQDHLFELEVLVK
jgi:uncharacterized protein YodC (DUF2158 family)